MYNTGVTFFSKSIEVGGKVLKKTAESTASITKALAMTINLMKLIAPVAINKIPKEIVKGNFGPVVAATVGSMPIIASCMYMKYVQTQIKKNTESAEQNTAASIKTNWHTTASVIYTGADFLLQANTANNYLYQKSLYHLTSAFNFIGSEAVVMQDAKLSTGSYSEPPDLMRQLKKDLETFYATKLGIATEIAAVLYRTLTSKAALEHLLKENPRLDSSFMKFQLKFNWLSFFSKYVNNKVDFGDVGEQSLGQQTIAAVLALALTLSYTVEDAALYINVFSTLLKLDPRLELALYFGLITAETIAYLPKSYKTSQGIVNSIPGLIEKAGNLMSSFKEWVNPKFGNAKNASAINETDALVHNSQESFYNTLVT